LPSIPLSDIQARLSGKGELYQTLAMPLGIMYLSSYIKKHNELGYVKMLDYALGLNYVQERNYQEIRDYIRDIAVQAIDSPPDVIAVSLIFSSAVHFFAVCISELKSLWPNAVSIVGGTHVTNAFQIALENPNVNYVLRGEGEIALCEFIKQLSKSRKIQVKGIYAKENLAKLSKFEKTDMLEGLDNNPLPDTEIINTEEYVSAKGRKKSIGHAVNSRISSFITSRGCPFNCTFCSSHTVHGKKLRFRSIQNVVQEIKLMHEKYGVNLFIAEDDLFTAKKDRLLNMLAAFRKLNIPDFELQLPSALHVNSLDKDIIDALIETGLHIAHVAIESGSSYVQKSIINKCVDLKKAKEVVSYFKSKGVIVRCYFILGFPGETKGLMRETVEYAKDLQADWCNFIIATPLVGSEMYDQFVRMGCIQEDFYLHSNTIFSERQFDTPEISADELNDFAYRANLDINFLNNYNKVTGQYEKAISIYQDILESYPFHIIGWYCVMECYRLMGDYAMATKIKEKINDLIKSDSRANEMFVKYKDLIPNVNAQ